MTAEPLKDKIDGNGQGAEWFWQSDVRAVYE